MVITFDQFKRSVQEGQRKLEDIVERKRIRDAKRREEEQQKGVCLPLHLFHCLFISYKLNIIRCF